MPYENTLYPLQDKVLSLIDSLGTPFYLTGGTALSRFHFKHRYSDDLDFFVNDDLKFQDYVNLIIKALAGKEMKCIVEKKYESFCRLTVQDILKVDFVNDVPAYYGTVELRASGPYSKIDNPMNILANKITAFSDRDEPKDISDIWVISKNLPVDWKEIFTAADSKAAGLNPPLIAKKMEEYDTAGLDRIKWVKRPSDEEFREDMKKVVGGILKII
ncbi:MAG: hypothetical protein CVV21_05695 [Candidatus Goldiibacteriota bacterium HGW-Goldbacteria-1]|jgi:predicted nucleotidyltransferase component of viral defense system|nr:MAG: hypothetical protein CVV21_05695 [Candidatus Goldiibacteriota bacterium HGW-Goldbacteria-1]